jgi:hypothetical protein
MEATRLPPMDWRLNQQAAQHQCQAQVHPQQQSASVDWRSVAEKSAPDFAFNVAQEAEPLRSSFLYQQSSSSQAFQHSHEVSDSFSSIFKNICSYMRLNLAH